MDAATFIDKWSKSLEAGTAGLFVGAGISTRAGYPDWRRLLSDIAKELGLDIESENDLAAVAQYSLNRAMRKRTRLAQLIAEHFPPKADVPPPLRTLARLPLRHIWTTNYDTLVETALRLERKQPDVRSKNNDLGVDKPWANAIVYKMHGTIDHPSDVVLVKDDYELYRRTRPGFLQVLAGHVITKQMLFVGFSFTDPNISHLFASIREAFEDDGPEHFAIVRRPKKGKGADAAKRLETDKIRHQLWVEDLQRYGIQCVEIDEYEDLDALLESVERRLAARNVFVSGAFPDTLHDNRRVQIEAIATEIGRVLGQREKRLVSGFGLVVGSSVVAGALSEILQDESPNLEKSLLLRPFPQTVPDGFTKEQFQKRYREGMIQQTEVCIFLGGLKEDSGKLIASPGVLEEFKVAKRLGKTIVPIGVAGGAAEKIWKQMAADADWTVRGLSRKETERLGDPNTKASEIGKLVGKVVEAAGG